MKVWKLKDILYNHQTLCILAKKGSFTTVTSPKCSCLQEIIFWSLWVVLNFQKIYWHKCIFLSICKCIFLAYDCTGNYWKVLAWGLTFQLFQQTVIIRIASWGVFTKCSSFQISQSIVNCYSGVHSFLRLSSAWSSYYMWKH